MQPLNCPFPKLFPSQLIKDDLFFMSHAYNQAIDAWRQNEIPIGAIIELNGEIIASSHNKVEQLKDPTAHAEILAITQASHKIGDWRLSGARLFVTKEPCPMCSGATIMSRLSSVHFAFHDPKMGCLGGATPLHSLPSLNHKLSTFLGPLSSECHLLLQSFFQLKRSQ